MRAKSLMALGLGGFLAALWLGACATAHQNSSSLSADEYFKLGDKYFDQGDYDHAIEAYTKCILKDGDNDDAWNNRGLAFKNKGNLDQAIADYSKSISINPKSATPYYNRGIAYDAKANWDLAVADLNQALKLKPDWQDAKEELEYALSHRQTPAQPTPPAQSNPAPAQSPSEPDCMGKCANEYVACTKSFSKGTCLSLSLECSNKCR